MASIVIGEIGITLVLIGLAFIVFAYVGYNVARKKRRIALAVALGGVGIFLIVVGLYLIVLSGAPQTNITVTTPTNSTITT
jgi:uncharacterized membrane protein